MQAVRDALRGDERGFARALGGLLLATGILVLLFRNTSFEDQWGDGLVFWILAATFAFLYGSGFIAALGAPQPAGWHSAFVVFGIVLLPLTLFMFLEWIDGDAEAPLNSAWIFCLVATAAFAAAVRTRIRYVFLLGSLSLIVVWLALWQELLSDGVFDDIGTLRGLLVVAAVILLALAGAVAMRGSAPERAASDVVTAAGLAAVAAGGISAIGLFVPQAAFFAPSIETNLFWDVELLVVSLALILYGSSAATRGAAYVGGFGLTAFIYVVGLDLDDDTPSGGVGWPLVLLIGGLVLFAFSVVPALRRERV